MSDENPAPQPEPPAAPTPVSMKDFLETVHPGKDVSVANAFETTTDRIGGSSYTFNAPPLRLHCSSVVCQGFRTFRCYSGIPSSIKPNSVSEVFLRYRCSDCQQRSKVFALHLHFGEGGSALCFKYGENPLFGPPTPSRLNALAGADRALFFKGRRSENQGLGIGAFGYYRRVVENQKNRILGEIIRVLQSEGAPSERIALLERAKGETQFSTAVTSIKDLLPSTLLINGRNPLTLLHTALSNGLHAENDEACLTAAHDIRMVLAEFAERVGMALKEDSELREAVNRLAAPKKSRDGGEPSDGEA